MRRLLWGLMLFLMQPVAAQLDPGEYEVVVTVANLTPKPRYFPVEDGPQCSIDTHHLCTQLLMGDCVRVISKDTSWVRELDRDIFSDECWSYVEVTGQHRCIDGHWVPLRGMVQDDQLRPTSDAKLALNAVISAPLTAVFSSPNFRSIKKSALLLGTRVHVASRALQNGFFKVAVAGLIGFVPAAAVTLLHHKRPLNLVQRRKLFIDAALKFLGTPFVSGGCSSRVFDLAPQITGVDHAGLLVLSARCAGISLPHCVQELFSGTECIQLGRDLQAGDCVFIARKCRMTGELRIDNVFIVHDPARDEIIGISCFGCPSVAAVELYGVSEDDLYCRCTTAAEHPLIKAALKDLAYGQAVADDNSVVYFGSIF